MIEIKDVFMESMVAVSVFLFVLLGYIVVEFIQFKKYTQKQKKKKNQLTPMQAYYDKRLLDDVLIHSMHEKYSKAVAPSFRKAAVKK